MEEGLAAGASSPPPRAQRRPRSFGASQDSPAQAWTATRCHRLLRPLLTHLAALRREHAARESVGATHVANTASAEPRPNKRRFSGEATASAQPAPRKKPRFTYSKKARSLQPPAEKSAKRPKKLQKPIHIRPGEVAIPTPVLCRVRGQQLLSSPVRQPLLATKEGAKARPLCNYSGLSSRSSPLEEELAVLRKQTASWRHTLYESIFRALEAILRATAEKQPSAGAVPTSKSLLSMCLRKVPDYVAELEYWELRDAEEAGTKSAISAPTSAFEVYNDLESIGAAGGWRHLRTVVRAHCIKIVKDAMSESGGGLFDLAFSRLLVQLCNAHGAQLEAAELLGALATPDSPFPGPEGPDSTFSEAEPLAPLHLLTKMSQDRGRPSFAFQHTRTLLAGGLLPEAWLSTAQFGAMWSSLTRAVSGTAVRCDEVLQLAVASIAALSKPSRAAARRSSGGDGGDFHHELSQHTFVSTLASLAAMLILGRETVSENPDPEGIRRVRTISRRVEYILQACLAETPKKSTKQEVRKKRYLLKLTLFLSTVADEAGTDATATAESLWRELDLSRATDMNNNNSNNSSTKGLSYDATVALIASTSHFCGRGASAPSHVYLTRICDRLLAVLGPPADGLVKRMRADGAFLLADRTGDLRDLAFAEGLGCSRSGSHARAPAASSRKLKAAADVRPAEEAPPPSSSPPKAALFAGYRWEEGISEWVTASPVLSRSRPKAAASSNSSSSRGQEDQEQTRLRPRPGKPALLGDDQRGSVSVCDDDDALSLPPSDEDSDMEGEEEEEEEEEEGKDETPDPSKREDDQRQSEPPTPTAGTRNTNKILAHHRLHDERPSRQPTQQQQSQQQQIIKKKPSRARLLSLAPDDELCLVQENRHSYLFACPAALKQKQKQKQQQQQRAKLDIPAVRRSSSLSSSSSSSLSVRGSGAYRRRRVPLGAVATNASAAAGAADGHSDDELSL